MKALLVGTVGFCLVNVVAAVLLIPLLVLAQRTLVLLSPVNEELAAFAAISVFISGVAAVCMGAVKVRVVLKRTPEGK